MGNEIYGLHESIVKREKEFWESKGQEFKYRKKTTVTTLETEEGDVIEEKRVNITFKNDWSSLKL